MSSNRDDHPAGQSPDQVPGGDRSGQPVQAARFPVSIKLPTERIALLDIPADMTAEEAVAIVGAVTQIRRNIWEREQATQLVVARPRLVLPT